MPISTVVRRIAEVVVLAVLFAGLQMLAVTGQASAAPADEPCSDDRTEPHCFGHDYLPDGVTQVAGNTANSSFNNEEAKGTAPGLHKISAPGVRRDLSGEVYLTRARLAEECLSSQSRKSIEVYVWYLCGSGPARGIEAIAQARFIAEQNTALGEGQG